MHDALDPTQVRTRAEFFSFVRALAADRRAAVEAEKRSPSSPYDADAVGWHNTTIDAYLHAALRWAQDTGMGESQGLGQTPSWQAFAVFLLCGKIYE